MLDELKQLCDRYSNNCLWHDNTESEFEFNDQDAYDDFKQRLSESDFTWYVEDVFNGENEVWRISVFV